MAKGLCKAEDTILKGHSTSVNFIKDVCITRKIKNPYMGLDLMIMNYSAKDVLFTKINKQLKMIELSLGISH